MSQAFRNSDIQMFRDSVAQFARKQIMPGALQRDEKEFFDAKLWKALGEMGLMGITVPEKLGGAGGNILMSTVALEEIGYCDAGVALSYGAHFILVVNNIYKNGNDEQRKKYLPKMASGEWIGSLCMTEPGAGSDNGGMSTTALRDGDHYVLNGTKTFITNANDAQVFVVYAKTDPKGGNKGVSAFIVEKGPGLTVSKKFEKMGMKSSATCEVVFDNVRVPVANRMGEEGSGFWQMLNNLDSERVALSGISIGIARRALDIALKYAQDRKQFNKPIAEFQMIQKMLADMATQTEVARSVVYRAAEDIDHDPKGRNNKLAAIAKLFTSEMATQVALMGVQVLGGYGYVREFEVERLVRDAKLMEIGAGTSEVHRMIIAREMLRSGKGV